MSVNLSASNLLDTGLPARVADLLDRHAVPPSAIVLEVTESVLLSDPDRSLAVVGALAALGTTVSIDDFGTGYASLTYLRRAAGRRAQAGPLVHRRPAHRRPRGGDRLQHHRAGPPAGLRVVAEGVEDDATLHDLRLLGCDESQGYLHSRAAAGADARAAGCSGGAWRHAPSRT